MTTAGAGGVRPRITVFAPPERAPLIQDSDMVVSMAVADPPAPRQMAAWAASSGGAVKVLFQEATGAGSSLLWLRYAPGYPLPRHSHDVDCLYFVLRGEARMGRRHIGAGGGFFVPATARYAYTAGPEGVELLEFRPTSQFETRISESLDRWDRIAEIVRENEASWRAAIDESAADEHA